MELGVEVVGSQSSLNLLRLCICLEVPQGRKAPPNKQNRCKSSARALQELVSKRLLGFILKLCPSHTKRFNAQRPSLA